MLILLRMQACSFWPPHSLLRLLWIVYSHRPSSAAILMRQVLKFICESAKASLNIGPPTSKEPKQTVITDIRTPTFAVLCCYIQCFYFPPCIGVSLSTFTGRPVNQHILLTTWAHRTNSSNFTDCNFPTLVQAMSTAFGKYSKLWSNLDHAFSLLHNYKDKLRPRISLLLTEAHMVCPLLPAFRTIFT